MFGRSALQRDGFPRDGSLGGPGFTALQVMQVVGERAVRIVPDVSVTGNGDVGGLLGALVGSWIKAGGPAAASARD